MADERSPGDDRPRAHLVGTAACTAEAGDGSGSFFHGANGAISQCGKGMAQSNSFFVHGGTIAYVPGADGVHSSAGRGH